LIATGERAHHSHEFAEETAATIRARTTTSAMSPGTDFAHRSGKRASDMSSLVRLLGFTTLTCGCVVGRYREVATSREISYVEEKGKVCATHGHRRNHTVVTGRSAAASFALATKAS
jgi:hypothetical protein